MKQQQQQKTANYWNYHEIFVYVPNQRIENALQWIDNRSITRRLYGIHTNDAIDPFPRWQWQSHIRFVCYKQIYIIQNRFLCQMHSITFWAAIILMFVQLANRREMKSLAIGALFVKVNTMCFECVEYLYIVLDIWFEAERFVCVCVLVSSWFRQIYSDFTFATWTNEHIKHLYASL